MKISSPVLPAHIAHKFAAAIAHCSNLSILGILSTGSENELVFFLGDGRLQIKVESSELLNILLGLHSYSLQQVCKHAGLFKPIVFPKLFFVCLITYSIMFFQSIKRL